VHWLEAQPITWSEFSRQLAENRARQEEAEAKRWEQVGGYVPWDTLEQWLPGYRSRYGRRPWLNPRFEYVDGEVPCPRCEMPASDLTWIRVPRTWSRRWPPGYVTVCHECELRVAYVRMLPRSGVPPADAAPRSAPRETERRLGPLRFRPGGSRESS
jgi:hypothetical protein